jgi:hypothetical protein
MSGKDAEMAKRLQEEEDYREAQLVHDHEVAAHLDPFKQAADEWDMVR